MYLLHFVKNCFIHKMKPEDIVLKINKDDFLLKVIDNTFYVPFHETVGTYRMFVVTLSEPAQLVS